MFATTNQKEPNAEPNEIANVPVTIRGCRATYDNRETLRSLGLRWDPVAKVWAGSIPSSKARDMRHLHFPIEEAAQPLPAERTEPKAVEVQAVTVRGGSATYAARGALRTLGLKWVSEVKAWKGELTREQVGKLEALGLGARARRPAMRRGRPEVSTDPVEGSSSLTYWDVTSGLPEGDREDDERLMKRHMRDLRARVKAVRAKIAADPEVAHTLATNPAKAAAFYAVHHVTEHQVKAGVPDLDVQGMDWEDMVEQLHVENTLSQWTVDGAAEVSERAYAALPVLGEP